jgi:hypothetical protein
VSPGDANRRIGRGERLTPRGEQARNVALGRAVSRVIFVFAGVPVTTLTIGFLLAASHAGAAGWASGGAVLLAAAGTLLAVLNVFVGRLSGAVVGAFVAALALAVAGWLIAA